MRVPPSPTHQPDPAAPTTAAGGRRTARRTWTPWRVVVGFGVVSLAADMVYEGARSITGPYLATLGASALVVGLVSGAGEATALLLRLAFGPLADRTGAYWPLTLIGYAMTAVCVPLLAFAPFLGAAGLAVAIALILAERAGKAVRSPAKSTLLAQAAAGTGLGRGFAVHKALDQIGAFAGPLVVAAVIAVAGVVWPGFALLAVPGVASLLLLAVLRRRTRAAAEADTEAAAEAAAETARELAATVDGKPDAVQHQTTSTSGTAASAPTAPTSSPAADLSRHGETSVPTRQRRRPGLRRWLGLDLPGQFFVFAAAAAAATAGLVTFGIISFHASRSGLIALSAVPVLYAAAMAAGAVAALVSGFLFDRWNARVLLALPVLGAAAPALVFSHSTGAIVAGALLWGAAGGVQDSTVKALVAALVPVGRRATAYGVFAAIQGAAALAGGAVVGLLYEHSLTWLVLTLVACQAASLVLLAWNLRHQSREASR